MADLLFECLSEEMPTKMQSYAVKYTRQIMGSELKKNKIDYKHLQIYTSPRRLTIIARGLPVTQEEKLVELRGPRVGAPSVAILGFLKKTGKNKQDLKIKNTEKGEFYFLNYKESSSSIQITLQSILEDLLSNFDWPKSMKWSNSKVKWVRPITNLLCLFGGDIIPVEFAGMKASNITYGHRFRSTSKIEISSVDDYLTKLTENYVILDQNERFSLIKDRALKVSQENGLNIDPDDELFREIAGLGEYPAVLLGKIDKEFMSLPQELVMVVMKNHQKYHYLLDQNKQLAAFFIVVSNSGNNDNVIKGNEKVLKARLADAKFLVEHDLQHNLEYYSDKLSNIIFHSKLGSIKEKVERIIALSKYTSVWVPNAPLIDVERSASLIKADLATNIVKEFAELQGTIGSYYAELAGENNDVIEAIREHYYPLNAESKCTINPIAITLSIADKVDTIVGLISVGEKVSGSRDPFALRRLAIGIIRTILKNKIMLPINLVIEKAVNLYPASLFKKKKILKIKKNNQGDKLYSNIVIENITTFFNNRFKAMLKADDINENIFNSIIAVQKNYVPSMVYDQAKYLNHFLQNNEGKNLITTYKRIKNILSSAEEKRKTKIRKSYNRALFMDEAEVELSSQLTKIKLELKEAVKNHEIESALNLLHTLAISINKFIDGVLINHENKELRNNRLRILSYIRYSFNTAVDFDHLTS